MEHLSLANYNIFYGAEVWEAFNRMLRQGGYSRVFLLVDTNTERHCLPVFSQHVDVSQMSILCVKPGEENKNLETCNQIWSFLLREGADRHSLMVNLGGGVVGDMGGFCAATFKRGMDFFQVPTTLLAQVDASIGGKLGVDFQDVKNCVGLFKDPKAVFIDKSFLYTLTPRQFNSGLAEVIKHALIADKNQWEYICALQNPGVDDWARLIIPSLQVKKAVVEQDPYEENLRKILNFGHTIGHAVESISLRSSYPLLHGEAVAIGMICESYLSSKMFVLKSTELKQICGVLLRIFGKFDFDKNYMEQLFYLMTQDKKNKGGMINFTMLKRIGQSITDQYCDDDTIMHSLDYYAGL